MRILITDADQPLGDLLVRELRAEHDLRLTGNQALAPPAFLGLAYTPADLREPGQIEPLLHGVEAVVHLGAYPYSLTPGPAAEKEALDHASRGVFVLMHAALKAGVSRVVLASRLDLMAAYPENYRVDETWRPRPAADAASLAPYLAELTVREFVRAEPITGICLRLGELGQPGGTSEVDAVAAVERALTMDLDGHLYRWWLYHIASTDRYPLGAAAQPPFNFQHRGTD